MARKIFLSVFIAMVTAGTTYAAHPLITDDTGTQGKGKFQVEVNSEFAFDREREFDEGAGEKVTVKTRGGEVATLFSYGVIDNMDIVLGLPYQWRRKKVNGEKVSRDGGISDISVELKWRFFEKEGLGFALKPGITLPTGNEKKGLGTGKVTGSLFLISTYEIKSWAFHANVGYLRNENKLKERKDIWHASVAGEVEVIKDLKLVGNVGIERNPDKASNTHPAFILGGLIYSIKEGFDVNFGVKGGLNKPETDLTFLTGIAFRF